MAAQGVVFEDDAYAVRVLVYQNVQGVGRGRAERAFEVRPLDDGDGGTRRSSCRRSFERYRGHRIGGVADPIRFSGLLRCASLLDLTDQHARCQQTGAAGGQRVHTTRERHRLVRAGCQQLGDEVCPLSAFARGQRRAVHASEIRCGQARPGGGLPWCAAAESSSQRPTPENNGKRRPPRTCCWRRDACSGHVGRE
jgi:hypothetical protein